MTAVRTVSVAPAPPARVTAFSVGRNLVGSGGGAVTLHATVANASRCTLRASASGGNSAAIAGLPNSQACKSSVTWRPVLPANPTASPTHYAFAFTAFGAHGTKVTRQTEVTVAAQDPPCPGQTSTVTPVTTAYFNDPTVDDVQHRDSVVRAMINLICDVSRPAAGVRAQIDLAEYIYELPNVSEALLWAEQYRSASVRLALDGGNEDMTNTAGKTVSNPAYFDLLDGIPTDGLEPLPAGSVVLCGPNAATAGPPPPGGDGPAIRRLASKPPPPVTPGADGTACAGENILHTKLLLVSSIDSDGDSAVFTGAQNLDTHGENDAFNNALQVVGNATIYQQNAAYFGHLMANAPQPDLGDISALASKSVDTPEGTLSDGYYPRNSPAKFPPDADFHQANDEATDATFATLKTVDCAADPGDFAGDHSGTVPRTVVQVAMYAFNNRQLVAAQLVALANAGCEVQVLYTNMGSKTLKTLSAPLPDQTAPPIELFQLSDNDFRYPDGTTARVFIHDKYVLISGAVDRGSGQTVTANQRILLTGSQNLTQVGLHENDEQTMQLQQTATAATGTTPIFDLYEADWTHIHLVLEALPATSR